MDRALGLGLLEQLLAEQRQHLGRRAPGCSRSSQPASGKAGWLARPSRRYSGIAVLQLGQSAGRVQLAWYLSVCAIGASTNLSAELLQRRLRLPRSAATTSRCVPRRGCSRMPRRTPAQRLRIELLVTSSRPGALFARAGWRRSRGLAAGHRLQQQRSIAGRLRHIGPGVSCVNEIGTMPSRLSSPTVGLMPTSALDRRRPR